jgi:CHAT domain
MKNLTQIIDSLVRECLERHYEQLCANSLLHESLLRLDLALYALVRESDNGIAMLREMTGQMSGHSSDQVDAFNAHGESIASLVDEAYSALWAIKPFLWETKPELFDKLLVVLNAKALWAYHSYVPQYHAEMHLLPGLTHPASGFTSRYIRMLLNLQEGPQGSLFLGQPLSKELKRIRSLGPRRPRIGMSGGGYPMLLDGSMSNPENAGEGLEDWQLVLDATRHSLPINVRDLEQLSAFIAEREETVDAMRTAQNRLHEFLEEHSVQKLSKNSIPSLSQETAREIAAQLRNITHFHLVISWDHYSEVSLSISGPFVSESGVTISTSQVLSVLNSYPEPNSIADYGDVIQLGKALFNSIFIGSSWRDKDPDSWEQEKYGGIISTYQRGRDHAETKKIEGTFTVGRIKTKYEAINASLLKTPYELLHDGDDFLCLKYSFYRYPISVAESPPFVVTGRFNRALLVAANPGHGYADISEVFDEVQQISKSLSSKDVDCTILDADHATIDEFIRCFEANSFDLVHFACHSVFDSVNPDKSAIVLGTPSSGPQHLDAISLRKYMRDVEVQIAFLNSCRSASEGIPRDSAGLVDCIVRGGVPCVIGMQWPISSDHAVWIAIEFYRRLLAGDSPESALRKTRRAFGTTHGWEDLSWGCPVLVQVPR